MENAVTPETIQTSLSLIDMISKGGFIMYPLIGFSILSLAVAIHKFLSIRAFKNEYLNLYREMGPMMASGRTSDIEWHFKKGSRPIFLAHEAIFDESLVTREDVQERLSRRLDAVQSELRKGLWILGTIASATPFVGLFGTVSGIMASFHSIGDSGKGGFGVVSAGISEALITTAAGILIAVLALMFYNYLQVMISGAFQDFRNRVEDLAQTYGARRNILEEETGMPLPPAMPSNRTQRPQTKGGYNGRQ